MREKRWQASITQKLYFYPYKRTELKSPSPNFAESVTKFPFNRGGLISIPTVPIRETSKEMILTKIYCIIIILEQNFVVYEPKL